MDETGSTDESDSDVDIVLSSYAAFARGDIDGAIANLGSDIEWIEPDELPNGGLRRGPVAVGEYLRAARAQWDQFISEPSAQRPAPWREHCCHSSLSRADDRRRRRGRNSRRRLYYEGRSGYPHEGLRRPERSLSRRR
jgi:ketosteroid isomerase-like protein